MSAALVILPVVWATEAALPPAAEVVEQRQTAPELAFYRKYTEALLRRYVRLSMEAGKVPSMMGREMFRGKVTHYRIASFDDAVIFAHDVERCILTLDEGQQHLIRRIALQEYTQGETAQMMKLSLRTVHRRYADALDLLTEIFLERQLLEPQTACQEG
jgi:predicted DNA-binding protein (UPF0251 family)